MAPNPRVAAAFRAMKDIGIKEDKVKPVLKKLLKLYDKNWELIEEENYRALADSIFEEEDAKVEEKRKKCNDTDEEDLEEAQVHDEPERPLKRLRLRSQSGQVSPPVNASNHSAGTSSLKRPKLEEDELPKTSFQQQPQEMMEKPQSIAQPISPQHGIVNKGKQPLLPQVASPGKRPMSERASHVVCIKEPTVVPGIVLLPKRNVPDTHALIKPKDEPFTDDMFTDDVSQYSVPIAVIHPDPSSKVGASVGNDTVEKQAGPEIPASRCLDEGSSSIPNKVNTSVDGVLASSSEREINCKLSTVPEEAPANLEIGSSPSGEEGSINITPTLDVLKKSSARDLLGIGGNEQSLCIPSCTSNGSVNIQCSAAVSAPLSRLPLSLNGPDDNVQASKKFNVNGGAESDREKESKNPESTNLCSLVVVPHCEIAPSDFKSLYDANDIARGEERVKISWINEINCDCLPSFKYIPQNLAFEKAQVNFTLSRIRDEDCCSTCLGDCLSLSTPCPCANEPGGQFAYTKDGLLREEFLEECISMTRDPQRHQHLYCRECPIERLRNDDCLEPCKGHLRRKFIKECWSKCGCSRNCGNRVVQRGITCKLQVFCTSEGKEWGLRTLEDMPKGAFVCEYVGEILTNTELFERNMQSKRSGKHTYSVLLDADWGSGVLKNEEALCLDATNFGNVARFINHRCLDANLVEIPVKVETPDHTYYHLAFFTTRIVAALEELTWDYGIDFDDHGQPVKAFRCLCGSKFCRNMKRSIRELKVVVEPTGAGYLVWLNTGVKFKAQDNHLVDRGGPKL
ncbi:probable inactive histone-lysine N-methyltransferase SUVR2 isoform X5 [Fagus crenata]